MADQTLTPEQQRRQVALRGMDKFADEHGCTDRTWREVDEGDRISFVGTADNGPEFCLAYMKAVDRERLV